MTDRVQQAMSVWQPYYDNELSQRDGEDIVENWQAFINIIAEWVTDVDEQGGV